MFHRAATALPEPPPTDRPVNPYAVGLKPDKWEADGLFDGPGMTLEEANKIVPGLDAIWDDSVNPFEGFEPPAGVTGGPPPGVAGGPPPGVAGGPPAGRPGGPPPGVFGGRPSQ